MIRGIGRTGRQIGRVVMILIMMSGYGIHAAALGFLEKSGWELTRRRSLWVSRYSRWALRILGVEVIESGAMTGDIQNQQALLVGNHLSYLDVLILSSLRPACFVTSEEIRETVGLGFLCEIAGCLFVERRHRSRLIEEIKELSEALRRGLTVAIFPEATSTNGETVLRFRRPLYNAAVHAQVPVLPFVINYRSIDGQPVTSANRDFVCWYGSMDFIPHLWRLAGRSRVIVELSWLTELNCDLSAEELAERSHHRVLSSFTPLGVN